MKTLIYKIACEYKQYNEETETEEVVSSLAQVSINNPTEEDIAKAKENAYNGEYTIDDDGAPEPVVDKSAEERIKELEEALTLLLEGKTE